MQARLQLVEAIATHKPHFLASARRGSTGLWQKVENALYDASHGQFRGIKPFSSRRNFRLFVSNIFTCAKKICLEDNGTIPKVIQDLNAFAIKYDAANKAMEEQSKEKKKAEKEKKERQEFIEKQILQVCPPPPRPSPPVLCTLDKTGLEVLASVSESVTNSSDTNTTDNQIVTPPLTKEVIIDVGKEEKEDEKMPARPKRKNSSLVQDGDSKKPSSIKNQIKFRSNDTINMVDEMIPAITVMQREIKGLFSEKKEDEGMKKLAYLERLVKLKADMSAIGENVDFLSKKIQDTAKESKGYKSR